MAMGLLWLEFCFHMVSEISLYHAIVFILFYNLAFYNLFYDRDIDKKFKLNAWDALCFLFYKYLIDSTIINYVNQTQIYLSLKPTKGKARLPMTPL